MSGQVAEFYPRQTPPSEEGVGMAAPHNMDAEQGLLGALLIDNRGLDKVDFLSPDDFFFPVHSDIFRAIRDFTAQGRQASPVTLKDFFTDHSELDKVGGAYYLADLAASVVSIVNVHDYARTVREYALRRRVGDIAREAAIKAGNFDLDYIAPDLITGLEEQLFKLAETGHEGGPVDLNEALDATVRLIERVQKGEEKGVMSGIHALDTMGSGYWGGDLITLAGATSMGKSVLAMNLAQNMAANAPVMFFSLEMSKEQLCQRLFARRTALPMGMQMREGALKPDDYHKLMKANRELASLSLAIDDTAGIGVHQIRARARRFKRRHGLGAVFVDYLGLISLPDSFMSMSDKLGEVVWALKTMARELDVPVFMLHQINRAVEGRDNKRPNSADLRDSGKIEQHSDIVMFVYREEYYLAKEEPRQKAKQSDSDYADDLHRHEERLRAAAGKAEIIVTKNRQGRTGTARVRFDGRRQVFYDEGMEG